MKTRIAKTLRAWAQRLSPLPMQNTIQPAPKFYVTQADGLPTVLELKHLVCVHDINPYIVNKLRHDLREIEVEKIKEELKGEIVRNLQIHSEITEGPRGYERIRFDFYYYGK